MVACIFRRLDIIARNRAIFGVTKYEELGTGR